MAKGDYFSRSMLESRAQKLLFDFAKNHILTETPPVPIERIAEKFLDLRLLWDRIEEPPGRTVLAKLVADERRIIFNEAHCNLYQETQFLYNTVLAHEIGHWDLHVERGTLLHLPGLLGFREQDYLMHSVNRESWDEKNAHRFMGYLTMPKAMVCLAVAQNPIENWQDFYRHRDTFEVTSTALRIRLEELGLLYIDADGEFHSSRQIYAGQRLLI